MAKRNEVYKCEVCGNIIEVFHGEAGELVCCGKPMVLQEENSVDAAQEKHVPVIEKTGNGVKVKVGEAAHPMDEDHYIEWIEILTDGEVHVKFLSPGDVPEATFEVTAENASAREYCTKHGLWKS